MFQCIFLVLFLNTYSSSLGNPIIGNNNVAKPDAGNSVNLGDLMTQLAKSCNNNFLSAQILSVVPECNAAGQSYNKKQIHCLMFYDMSQQLCTAAAQSKLTIDNENMIKLNQSVDIVNLCNVAKSWVTNEIPGFDKYTKITNRIFKTVACAEICGLKNDAVEDLLNISSNIYCKFYKWGNDMLNASTALEAPPQNNEGTQEQIALPSSGEDVAVVHDDTKPETDINVNMPVSSVIQVGSTNVNLETHPSAPSEPALPETGDHKDLKLNTDTQVPKTIAKNDKTPESEVHAEANKDSAVVKLEHEENKLDKTGVSHIKNDKIDKVNEKVNEGVAAGEAPPGLRNMGAEENDPQLDNVGQGQNGNEHQPSSDDDEAFDNIGEDDDPDDGMNIREEQAQNRPRNNEAKVLSGESSHNAQLPFIADTFPEEDDHFFPLFLTAVILVVLLYILYHNKSKVSKVFFGLIIEGRQPGRRRNSRGHAYRRLDTLEQAMSTNTAAPPSKIIY